MAKALRYDAPYRACIVESMAPVAAGKISVASTLVTSISAGTEMGFYRGTAPQIHTKTDSFGLFSPSADAITYPMQSDGPGVWWMGYSGVGRVTAVGSEEKNLQVGDLVWTYSGHKSVMVSDSFLKLPADMKPERAAFLALVEIAFNGMLDAHVKLLDDVVIIGMGTLGQLLVQMCKFSGARVTAVDYLDTRLDLAKKFGADTLFNPGRQGDLGCFVQQNTQGRGADVVIEVSGNTRALPQAVRCAGYDGTVIVMSFYQGAADTLQLGQEFHHKRIRLRSSQVGGIDPILSASYNKSRRKVQVLDLLGKLDLNPLISHRVAFSELPQALEMIDRDPAVCQAVIVTYQDNERG